MTAAGYQYDYGRLLRHLNDASLHRKRRNYHVVRFPDLKAHCHSNPGWTMTADSTKLADVERLAAIGVTVTVSVHF